MKKFSLKGFSLKRFSLVALSRKIPAGIMIVPLFIGAILNTFFPAIFTFGSYTTIFFSDTSTMVLMYATLFYTGCQIRVKDLPIALARGGSHVLLKYIAGAGFYLLIVKYFGQQGILGVCSLSLLCALTNCNSNLYMTLMDTYGDSADKAARPMFNLNSGPMLSLVTIGASGMIDFSPIEILSLLAPVVVGVIIAAVEPKIQEQSKSAIKFIIPLVGLILGSKINLLSVIGAGFGGVLLFLIVVVVTGPVAFITDRLLLRRPGYAGMSTVSVAGNTVAVPAMILAVAPEFAPYVELAIIQLSSAVIISAFVCPVMVNFFAKKFGCPAFEALEAAKAVEKSQVPEELQVSDMTDK